MIEVLKRWRIELQFYLKYGHKIKKIHKKGEVVYICAENAVHGNMGDQALGYCRSIYMQRIGMPIKNVVEYTSRDRMRYWPQICRIHTKEDVVVLRGGGFWGDLWEDGFEAILLYIQTFHSNRIVVFPQSVYFGNTEHSKMLLNKSQIILGRAERVFLFAKDEQSYKRLKKYYPKCAVFQTPDTVLSYRPELKERLHREGVLICLRDDKEKNPELDDSWILEWFSCRYEGRIFTQDTAIDFNLQKLEERKNELFKMWSRFAQAKLVVTDRLHGMIFSAITSTPCIVFDNLDGKVKEQYKWIQDLEYILYVQNPDELPDAVDKLLSIKDNEYPLEEMWGKFRCLQDVLQMM